ncbi:MAG: pseudouridine synthase Rsu [Bacteroidetes bacterium]|jgi:23S rRNA pseudouridine2604 synthase|nr:pseudouridine synthase Rsu [Bacteroidota bacterium]
MQFRFKLQYQLVRILRISNKEAADLIAKGHVRVNNEGVEENILIGETDDIYVGNELVRKGKELVYILYHKPRGFESSMNPSIAHSLQSELQLPSGFYHIGRLDKDSEGLLLLSNDGRAGKTLLNKEKNIPKIYEVEVDKAVDETFLRFLENGVVVRGRLTLPCTTRQISERVFEITLVEGMNRQIRRMCYKYGHNVVRLVRTGFAGIKLDIATRQQRFLSAGEIDYLRSL